MALLKYDIAVVGMANVEKAFASIERRFIAHNSRINRALGATTGAAGGAGGRPKMSDTARGFDQIGRAARAADMKASRDRERAEARLHQQRLRHIEKEAAAAVRAEQRAAAAAQRRAVESRRSFARGTMGALQGATGAAAGMGKAGLALAGVGGSMAAGVAINTEMSERQKAAQLANQAGKPGMKGQLLTEARGVKGFTGAEALGGMEAFVTKTGDLDTARAIIGDLGKLSLATGANLEDLGETAGQAFNVIRDQIQDPKEQMTELRGIMTTLAQQGNLGSVEIRDLARDFGKLGASTRGFEGGSGKLLRTMGAFAQLAVARGGAESSAEASTAASRLVGDIVTNKKKFQKLGVKIKSDTDPTKLRDPMAIIKDVLDKTGGDVMKTSGLFGIESAKIFKGLAPIYAEAEKRKKGSGRAAVDAEFNRFATATMNPKELDERYQSALSEPAVQFKETMKGLNDAMGKELLPVAVELGSKLKEATPAIGAFAKKLSSVVLWLAENPWKGIGIVVAGAIVKEIAAAAIGAKIKALIERPGGVPTGGGTTVVGGGGRPSGGSMLGAASGIGLAYLGANAIAGGANELRDASGMKHTAAGLMHGFDAKTGEFSVGQFLKDSFNPFSVWGKATALGGEAGIKLAGGMPELKRGTGAIAGASGGALQMPALKLEGVEDFKQSVIDFGAKVAGMPDANGGGKPNRGDKPTP